MWIQRWVLDVTHSAKNLGHLLDACLEMCVKDTDTVQMTHLP
jgi:hypothetical protein